MGSMNLPKRVSALVLPLRPSILEHGVPSTSSASDTSNAAGTSGETDDLVEYEPNDESEYEVYESDDSGDDSDNYVDMSGATDYFAQPRPSRSAGDGGTAAEENGPQDPMEGTSAGTASGAAVHRMPVDGSNAAAAAAAESAANVTAGPSDETDGEDEIVDCSTPHNWSFIVRLLSPYLIAKEDWPKPAYEGQSLEERCGLPIRRSVNGLRSVVKSKTKLIHHAVETRAELNDGTSIPDGYDGTVEEMDELIGNYIEIQKKIIAPVKGLIEILERLMETELDEEKRAEEEQEIELRIFELTKGLNDNFNVHDVVSQTILANFEQMREAERNE